MQHVRIEDIHAVTIAQRVESGFRFVNARLAPGWQHKVLNDPMFDIGDYRHCLLAIVSDNDYQTGCRMVGLKSDGNEPIFLGLQVTSFPDSDIAFETRELTRAWITRLEASIEPLKNAA